MNSTISITPRRLMLLGIFGILAVLTYGFANSNVVPASNAGDGTNTISGYTVTNVHYVLNSSNPSTVDQVSFTLAPPLPGGGATRVSLNGTWLAVGACSGTTNVICTATGTTVLSLSDLRVVAAQ
jgi:hypothetical protein